MINAQRRLTKLVLFILVAHPYFSGGKMIMGFVINHLKLDYIARRRISLSDDTSKAEVPNQNHSVQPDILQSFLPASDPRWACIGPVGEENFVLSRERGPTDDELANENILKIVTNRCSDLEVNTLVWKCLGYRYDSTKEEWSAIECFPNWQLKHPKPPDLIGMQRM
jgi:hypothetical protein